MSEPIEPVDEKGEYRGVAYTLSGDYMNKEKTRGVFAWSCRYGRGFAGDPETAKKLYIERIIDANLDLAE